VKFTTDTSKTIQSTGTITLTVNVYGLSSAITKIITYSVSKTGVTGSDGKGLATITEYYLVSSASTGITISTAGWSTTIPKMTSTNKYLWNYELVTYSDSTTETHTPKIIGVYGDTGEQGTQGIQGVKGTDGISTYFYIRYSASSDGTSMVETPTTNTIYMGVCSTTSASAPTDKADYSWSKIKGEQGEQGAVGTTGADGKTSYLHIKYSDDGTTFTANSGETVGNYIGTYVDFASADSTTFTDYAWKKIVGADVSSLDLSASRYVVAYYADGSLKDSSDITLTAALQNLSGTLTWTTSPTVTLTDVSGNSNQKKLAASAFASNNQISVTVSCGTLSDIVTIVKVIDGTAGATGKGISSITEHYLASASSSGITTSTSGWTTEIQTITLTKKYLWIYQTITYTDSTTKDSIPIIIGIYGDKGEQGIQGVSGADGVSTYFYVRYSANSDGSSMTTVPSSSSVYMGVCSSLSSSS
jgi:hypothetical protein